MRGVVMHAPGDVRVQDLDDPQIVEPTDAIIRVTATCVCGSDLWPYRGIESRTTSRADGPRVRRHRRGSRQRGHDRQARPVRRRARSVASDNTCQICRSGYQTRASIACPWARVGAQAERLRVPLADGTLVATPGHPRPPTSIPSLLAASDVLGTGWFGAVAAEAGPGKTVAVVGDGAVGLLAVLAAKQLGAERIIAMSRHERAAAAGPRVRRDRHRRPSAATRAWRRSRNSPTGWARTRSSRRSAPRSR